MSNGIHGLSPNVWPAAHVARSTCFADSHVLVVGITQLAYRRPALSANHPHLAAWQDDGDPIAFLGHNPRGVARTSDQLSTLTGTHLDVVNLQAGRDSRQGHGIADLGLTREPTFDAVPNLHTQRRQNIPFFAVGVVQQRDEAIPVRVVFNRCHLRRDTILIALEIDDSVNLSSAPTSEATGRDTTVVSSAVLLYPPAK
jgi:hypothetical protein